jgi:hypothetical protein
VALLSGICVLVWALSGGGTFWPAAVVLLAVAGVTIDIASRRLRGPSGRVDELERQLRASSRK